MRFLKIHYILMKDLFIALFNINVDLILRFFYKFQMKILIVEDDIAVQNFLKRGFNYKQCAIDQAFDGLEGLEKNNRQ